MNKSKLKPLGIFAAGVLVGLLLAKTALGNTVKPKNEAQMGNTSVMITNLAGNSGGTGVILESTPTESTILTNGHVCEVAKKGGKVKTQSGQDHAITGYKMSKDHDLCLLTVAADLGLSTTVAEAAPDRDSNAAISGHPKLLPNVVTKGHFSGKEIIGVMTGFRECNDKDLKGDDAILCLFFGGIPQVKTYEAQLVTATIMPGSSGSAVYNTSGEISGLVFAGSGNLGYAYIVPQESVANFVNREAKTLTTEKPNNTREISLTGGQDSGRRALLDDEDSAYRIRVLETCKNLGTVTTLLSGVVGNDLSPVKNVCKVAERDMVWRNF